MGEEKRTREQLLGNILCRCLFVRNHLLVEFE